MLGLLDADGTEVVCYAYDAWGRILNVGGDMADTLGTEQPFRAESIGGRTVMEIKSPSIKISVKSDMAALITTKIIDGREFLMIPVQDDIEVNGIRIRPGTAAASGETDGDR